ncbi:hypothetical protein KFZ58_15255 [Virgibacillus sp. NKC19-16]|uniref:hypothetical protein n=1 Tax=Virgibacillus salidurans TaxID=2831673 RepID=UPI001F3AB953|nr:hypothetical protein [Virgibacillus sp. NKC19-16]UJL45729.1 hypothetical protein KFZ58_15255 [Virgibacillus sp. NKC19-16]
MSIRNISWIKGQCAYFKYTIRNCRIDLMRKQNKQQENAVGYMQEQKTQIDDGNYYRNGAFFYSGMKVAESEVTLYDAGGRKCGQLYNFCFILL